MTSPVSPFAYALRDAKGTDPPMTPEGWLAAAADRPALECWGKAKPTEIYPAHPALYHMLDVAAVAQHLLTTHLPRAARRRLLNMCGSNEADSIQLLLFIVALHDIGKYTPAFQAKVDWARQLLPLRGFDLNPPATAKPHGPAGVEFIAEALAAVGIASADALRLARAVAAHHGEFPTNQSLNLQPMGSHERGRAPRWGEARKEAVATLRSCFNVAPVTTTAIDHAGVMALSGLTSVADWIGSMEDFFPYEPPTLPAQQYWRSALERALGALEHVGMRPQPEPRERRFSDLFPSLSPWPLHTVVQEIADGLSAPTLVIVEAPMGEGKTEAALLLAQAAAYRLGQHGFYIGLPTRATANQMFGRVTSFLNAVEPDAPSTLVLAHGEAHGIEDVAPVTRVYDDDSSRLGGVRAEEWFLPKKRALLAEYGVGTIDQALLGVLRTRHGFVRLFGLAGKTVVLDEVHAYDTFTSTILDRLLEWLAAMGTTVVLLSATLPRVRRHELLAAYRRGLGGAAEADEQEQARYPRVTVAALNHSASHRVEPRGASVAIAIQRIDPDIEGIARLLSADIRNGGCVGWICNTVARAQAACAAVAKLAPDVARVHLHASMLPDERRQRERQIEQALGPERSGAARPERLIVIGTQVLEQSLDIDFDLLVTDLAPIDLLLQRAGRLHRHRSRGNRAAARELPRLLIAYPAGPFDTVAIGEVARVYAEALVRATIRTLDGRSEITLPDDIEPLVEQVYGGSIPAGDDALFGAFLEHFGSTIASRQSAQTRLLPRPTDEDDIFGNLRMPFSDDDDPQVHHELRAITRDTDLSVQVVCLVGRDGKVFGSEESSEALDMNHEPDRRLTALLARRTITVSKPAVVRALLGGIEYQPPSWQERALLRHRRALVFTEGVARIAGYRLELHRELGLVARKHGSELTT